MYIDHLVQYNVILGIGSLLVEDSSWIGVKLVRLFK